jgi:hypothetical protein
MFSKKAQKKMIALLEKHLQTLNAALASQPLAKEVVIKDTSMGITENERSDRGTKMLEKLYQLEIKLNKLHKDNYKRKSGNPF